MLDFDKELRKFRVLKRVEVPRAEYTIDNAVNWVIEINKIYKPAWIFCDRGAGEYQLERLHIYGDKNPDSGLKHKVVGYQFKQNLEIIDPITKELHKEPMKPFMVNQLTIAFDRGNIMLSPFDETLHKQLVDYTVERVSQSGLPVYTSKNEHFVDALGLAYLAFVLNFPDLTKAIQVPRNTSRMEHSPVKLGGGKGAAALREIERPVVNPWKQREVYRQAGKGPDERRGDYQQWVKIPLQKARPSSKSYRSWGSRGGGNGNDGGRTMW